MLTISGTAGGTTTTFTFSGTSTWTGTDADLSHGFRGGAPQATDLWKNIGSFFTGTDSNYNGTGDAEITVGLTNLDLDEIAIDEKGGNDEMGFGVDGADLMVSEGDVVSWTGSLTVTGLSIDLFTPGNTYGSDIFGSNSSGQSFLDLDVTVTSVPEPTGAILGMIALTPLVLRRRRNRR